MSNLYSPRLNKIMLLVGLLLALSNCKDKCEVSRTYKTYTPVYKLTNELRNAVAIKPAEDLQQVGKIYYRYPYVFINEVKKGIHIIDNRNPKSPKNIAFVNIPGNVDLAVKDNILYADSYIDLLAIDISNPEEVKVVKRIENVFPQNYYYSTDNQSILTEWEEGWTTVTAPTNDCDGANFPVFYDFMTFSGQQVKLSTAGAVNNFVNSNAGKGGSMARFTIYQNYLYTVSQSDLQVFNINNPSSPTSGNKINLNWGVETIFPYKDKLFIGSNAGMYIYNNQNPESPSYLGQFQHARACDPVVVEGDYAYVTLRSGNFCNGFVNQLDVVNIQNLTSPTLVKSYPMQNPHGLGIDKGTLFICEGNFGLKVFDAKDVSQIDKNLLKEVTNLHAFDVIPLGEILLLIGEDGLYQYDYSNPKDIQFLSKISVVKND